MARSSDTPFRLGILDQAPIPEGSTAGEALTNTIDLARLADELGYYRYWVAEHHGTPGLACHSPEVLIGPIAAQTSRIRVGSGGVMLPHYSPLKVAETFGMLAGLFPGRIDLGIGRAAGTSPAVAFALQRDRRQRAPDDFPEQLHELLGYFGWDLRDKNELFPQLPTKGMQFESPELTLLGSSSQSAIWAAEIGLPYVFADFINPAGGPIAALYRERFQASTRLPGARTGVAVWAICADTDGEAQRLTLSLRMMMTLLQRGLLIAVPTVERAERFFAQEGVRAELFPVGRRIIAGAPGTVRKEIEAVAGEYEADEALIVNILHDHEARRRSYELIAREFGISRSGKLICA